MKTSRQWLMMAVVLGTSMVLACGSDPEPAGPATTAGTGSTNVSGTGSFPVAGQGLFGASGAGGTGFALPTPVTCGDKMCTGLISQPCCADMATGTCGTMSGTMCQAGPPPAPNCPNISVAVINVNGCCIDSTQMCGIDGSMFGMGCIDLSTAGGIPGASAFLGNLTPTRCDGTKVMTDAGAGGAGGTSAGGAGGANSGGSGGASGAAGHVGGAGGASGSAGHSGAAGH